MRWDDSIGSGTHDKWTWIVVRQLIRGLPKLTKVYHGGQHLCITAFDSGPLTPSVEEQTLGWSQIDGIMVSPPLTLSLDIPCDTYDEWYLFRTLPDSFSLDERYVNYLGFTLANPRELSESVDPTWDRTNFDWLIPIQERFWTDIERLNPSSYVCSGDADIVVTQDTTFAARILEAARDAAG